MIPKYFHSEQLPSAQLPPMKLPSGQFFFLNLVLRQCTSLDIPPAPPPPPPLPHPWTFAATKLFQEQFPARLLLLNK